MQQPQEAPGALRERYDGAALALAAAILPFCVSPAWMRYDERATARVNRKGIEQHGTLIAKLVRLQPNLGFKQSSMEAAMRFVVEEKRGSWDLQSDEEKVWVPSAAPHIGPSSMLQRARLHQECIGPRWKVWRRSMAIHLSGVKPIDSSHSGHLCKHTVAREAHQENTVVGNLLGFSKDPIRQRLRWLEAVPGQQPDRWGGA